MNDIFKDMQAKTGCETMTDVAYYYIDELQVPGDIPSQLQNYIVVLEF